MSTRRPFEPTGTTLTFTPDSGSTFEFNYIEITPPSVDGGEPIDTTLLSTTDYKTKMAPKLKDMSNIPFKAEYQPKLQLEVPYGVGGELSIVIPEEGTFKVRAYLKGLQPDPLRVNERATMSGEFVVTNTAADGKTQVLPDWTDA